MRRRAAEKQEERVVISVSSYRQANPSGLIVSPQSMGKVEKNLTTDT